MCNAEFIARIEKYSYENNLTDISYSTVSVNEPCVNGRFLFQRKYLIKII